MKKITTIIIAISASLLFTSCLNILNKEAIKGNGELITKSIAISEFSEMEIETFVEVNYSQAPNTGNLEFTIDDNLWEYCHIYTKDEVLHIKLKSEYKNRYRLMPTKSLLTVSSEQLENVAIAGSSKINFCTDFTSKNLNIDIAGSGKIIANQYPVKIEDFGIEIAGSGNVQLKGEIEKAEIEIAGSGNVNALDCEIAQLQVIIAGSGNVEAGVTDMLSVKIAGSGSVKYRGSPGAIETDIAGSGKIVKL